MIAQCISSVGELQIFRWFDFQDTDCFKSSMNSSSQYSKSQTEAQECKMYFALCHVPID